MSTKRKDMKQTGRLSKSADPNANIRIGITPKRSRNIRRRRRQLKCYNMKCIVIKTRVLLMLVLNGSVCKVKWSKYPNYTYELVNHNNIDHFEISKIHRYGPKQLTKIKRASYVMNG